MTSQRTKAAQRRMRDRQRADARFQLQIALAVGALFLIVVFGGK